MNIALIILNWNGKKDTLECLDSIAKLDYEKFETIVVDNGSTDGSLDSLPTHVTVLKNKENLGFAEGNNVGIRYALEKDFDAVVLLNNDTIVDPQFLSAFARADKPIQGALIYLYQERDRLDHLGGTWNPRTASFDFTCLRAKEIPEELSLDYLCGCALFVRRGVFETIGLLESKFFLIWEESDFCFRAKRAGFPLHVCREALVWHKVSASFTGGKPHSTYFWWRNRLLWIERNCTRPQKVSLYLRVLLPEIFHLYKLFAIKSLFPSKNKKEKLLQYRAALTGIHHYICRRFGNGPAWIYKKKPMRSGTGTKEGL